MDKKEIGLVIVGIVFVISVVGALFINGGEETGTESAEFEISDLSLSSSEIRSGGNCNRFGEREKYGG